MIMSSYQKEQSWLTVYLGKDRILPQAKKVSTGLFLSLASFGPVFRIPTRRKFRRPEMWSPEFWSECRDSNPGPLGPEPSAIPNFATPRNPSHYNGLF